jgi:3',5'-cyclic AMP phosphodiesterase CpdA
MFNTMLIAKFLKAGILKFSYIITTDSHDRAVLLNLNFLEQFLSLIKCI